MDGVGGGDSGRGKRSSEERPVGGAEGGEGENVGVGEVSASEKDERRADQRKLRTRKFG